MKRIYLAPHSHYDVVWAFNKDDYLRIQELILKKAVGMIEKEDFRFLIEQTFLLEMIEERDPKLFERVKRQIEAGKIEIVDGQYMMPDPMIPGGEVLVREILFGKRYVKEKFGLDVPVAWASDGFGLNAQMPQIYKKSGYTCLGFRRGLPQSIGSRVSEFIWEGLDGSRITTHWMPLGYRAGLWLDKWEESFEKLKLLATGDSILMPCGSGGAIPQEDIPQKVREWNEGHPDLPMQMATPGDFFKAFMAERRDLVTYSGEMYSAELENIFPDVVSSRIRLKLAARKRENLLVLAEKAAALAWLAGGPYPSYVLREMWKKMLFLGFHDVMPSCGIDEIYDEAWDYIRDLKKNSRDVTRESLRSLTKARSGGHEFLVFNPNNWEVVNWVEGEMTFGARWGEDPGIFANGEEIPSEAIEVERWDDGTVRKARIGFVAEAPPLGCRVYEVGHKAKKFNNSIRVEGTRVVNRFYNLEVDEKGILHVHDSAGTKILTGNEVIIDEELGDLYFHRSFTDVPIGSESGVGNKFGLFRPGKVEVQREASRTIVKFTNAFYSLRWPYYLVDRYPPMLYRHKALDVVKKVILYEDLPRIDFVTSIDLLQSHVRIRLKFDTGMIAPVYRRQTQFGVIELPRERILEEGVKVPALAWINAQEENRGLAFLTQGVPINEVRGGDIFCTLLRSVSVLSSDGVSGPLIATPGAMELGQHTYQYAVYPYQGTWKEAGIHRRAYEIAQGLLALQMDAQASEKELPRIRLEPDNLIVSCFKKAEGEDALILRFFETKGEKCEALLELPPGIKRAAVANLLEQDEEERPVKSGRLRLDVGPFEIVTLKIWRG